jgi:hypothetical protein
MPQAEPAAQPKAEASAPAPRLPHELASAKPNYAFGAKEFALDFESDIDKAAFIAAQFKPSKADAQYVGFVRQATGLSTQAVRSAGVRVRSAIKELARDAEPGVLRVPDVLGRRLKPPGGETFFAPKLKDARGARSPQEYFAAADSRYEALLRDRPGHIYVNAPAHGLIVSALRHAGLPAQNFAGLTLGPADANLLYRALGEFEQTEQEPGVRAAIGQMRAAMRQAAGESKTLTFVRSGPDVSAMERRTARREEEFHRQQILRTRGKVLEGHVDSQRLSQNQTVHKGLRAIERDRHETGQRAYVELAASLASGQWGDLGLTREEAIDALHAYIGEIVRLHGDQAGGIINHVHPAIRNAVQERLAASGQPATVAARTLRRRPGHDAGPGSGGQFYRPLRGVPEGRPEDLPSQVRSDLSARTAPVEHAGPGTLDLFGEEANQTSREAAKSDAAKLEADRLTAEFGSALNRNNLRKKLKPGEKPQQGDLFGGMPEKPAQGKLLFQKGGTGPHGPIFTEFRHDAAGAIAKLRQAQSGEAVAALHHPAVGDIDLIWGESGTSPGNGYGLAKLAKWHPEILDNLQETLDTMTAAARNENTVQLDSATHHAVVRRNWKGNPKTWLLTAFEKKQPSLAGRTMDISGTREARRDDTAPPPSGGTSSMAPTGEGGKREKTSDFWKDESGEFDLANLRAGLREKFGEAANQANYTGLGAKDIFLRNLSQLEKTSSAGHAAAVRAAASKGQVAALLRAAVPRIEAAIGKRGPTWTEFRTALIESRLRGIRERWRAMAEQALDMSPAQMQASFDNGVLTLLENIQDKRGLGQDLAETAAAMFQSAQEGDLAQKKPGEPAYPVLSEGPHLRALRDFLSTTYLDAAESVAEVLPDEFFHRITSSPGFARGLEAYRELLEKPMADNHALNEGVFSDALGPVGAYYPLVPVTSAEAAQAKAPGTTSGYRKPRNISNDFATGLALRYDAGMEALRNRLTRAIKANNKAALIQTLEDEGLLRKMRPNEVAGDVINIGGEDFKADYIKSEGVLVPTWLRKELVPILELEGRPHQLVQYVNQVMQVLNKLSLVGPLNLVYHATNLLGTLTFNTPFIPGSVLGEKVGNSPLTKQFYALVRILHTDPTTADAVADMTEMAKVGALPDRFGSETFSQRFAEQLGAEDKMWRFEVGGRNLALPKSAGPILFGPKGMDIRARLLMWRIAKQLQPQGNPQSWARSTNQLGVYVRGMQSDIERALKASGFSPFFTAGSTMVRNGINGFLGRGPITSDKFSYRLKQLLTGGAPALIAIWALINKAYRGKWPWEEPNSKLLAFAVKPADRNSALGRALWGSKPGTAYVNLAFINPLLARGLRALGIMDAYETRQLGGSFDQITKAAVKGSANAFIGPAAGPLVRTGMIAATGREPYLTDVQDVTFMRAAAKKPGFLRSRVEYGKEAALSLNNFFGNLATATGIGYEAERAAKTGNAALRMLTDLAAPRLVGTVSDQSAKARRLANERRAAARER